jgi:hypothetical protein
LIEAAKPSRVVHLSEHDEAVDPVVPLDVVEAGLAALGRAAER